MGSSPEQSGVARGMALALLVTVVGFLVAALGNWPQLAAAALLEGRALLLAKALLGPALVLMVSIGRLAAHRFHTPADINGSALTTGTDRARLLQALLQNTVEQTLLAALSYAAACLLLPAALLPMVAWASGLFVIGRLLFFAGYAKGAAHRAFGFALTFYPSVLLLLLALVWMVSRGG